jgi:hypothetical protein
MVSPFECEKLIVSHNKIGTIRKVLQRFSKYKLVSILTKTKGLEGFPKKNSPVLTGLWDRLGHKFSNKNKGTGRDTSFPLENLKPDKKSLTKKAKLFL